MKKTIFAFIFSAGASLSSQAQISILAEDFQQGIPANWTVWVEDTNTVNTAVSEFAPGWIALPDPNDSLDTIVGSTSYFTDSDLTASRWLISPPLTLGAFGNELSWSARAHDPSYPDGYRVVLSNTDADPSSFTDTLSLILEEYENWTVRTVNLSDSGYFSQTVYIAFINNSTDMFKLYLDDIQLTIENPVGIIENNTAALSIYPNPTSESLTVKTTETVEQLNVYSGSGQLLSSHKNTDTIAVNELQTGIYLLEIKTINNTYIKRFMKK